MYKSFQDLPVWENAITLAEDIFFLTRHLPRSEDYGLTSQMRRAANSIHANIAEAFGREYFKDKKRFYTISKGSAYELLSHIIYGIRVHYFSEIECDSIHTKIEILIIQLSKIIKTLRNKTEIITIYPKISISTLISTSISTSISTLISTSISISIKILAPIFRCL